MLLSECFLIILITCCYVQSDRIPVAERSKNVTPESDGDSEKSRRTVSLADDPTLWPGHLKPFGSSGPVHSIDLHTAYPTPVDFINNYAAPYVPVHCKSAEKGSFPFKNWKNVSYFLRLPQSFTSWVKLHEQTNLVSFRKYADNLADKGTVFEQEVPYFLRDDVSVPKCLLCNALLGSFSKQSLWISHRDHSSKLERRNTDTLRCVYVGRQELTLISHIEYGDKMPADYKNIDVKRVDYQKYPTLREVEYHKVKVKAGDCVFIPTKWFWQFKSIGKTYAVDIEWYHRNKGVKEKECKLEKEVSNLKTINFKDGSNSDSSQKDVVLHYLTSYFTLSTNYTFLQFQSTVKKDQKLMEDMVEWNDEFTEITREIFDTLDVNSDGLFSLVDLESLNPDLLEDMRGLLEDRIHDYEDIMKDQQEEKKAATEGAETAAAETAAAAAAAAPSTDTKGNADAEKVMQEYLKDYLAKLQDVIHESIEEMAVTGELPDIKQKLAEKQSTDSTKGKIDNESKSKDQIDTAGKINNSQTEREKAKAKIKINQEKKKLKEQKEEELRNEKRKEEDFVIVDDSMEEEIFADDEEDRKHKHETTKKTGAETTKKTGAETTKKTGAETTKTTKKTGAETTKTTKKTGADTTKKTKKTGAETTKKTGAETTKKTKKTGAETTKKTGAETIKPPEKMKAKVKKINKREEL